MSLVQCHECRARISDEAMACPHCGAANPKASAAHRRMLWLWGILLGILTLVWLGVV